MSELLVVLDALRREIQADRLAMTNTINSGFDKLEGMIQSHAKDQAMQILKVSTDTAQLESRLFAVETRQASFGRRIWAIIITILGAITSAITAYFFPRHP